MSSTVDYDSDDSFDGVLAGPIVKHQERGETPVTPRSDGSKWPHDDPAKAWDDGVEWCKPSLIQKTHEDCKFTTNSSGNTII